MAAVDVQELRSEREELTEHLAALARDLQNLQRSIQVARTLREGTASPGHVWPDAPSFDPAEELTPAWVAGVPAHEEDDEAGEIGEIGEPEEEQRGLVLMDYPTFPL